MNEPTYLPTYSPTNQPSYQPTYPLTHRPTYLPTHPSTDLPTYLPTHPPTNLPPHPPTLLTYLAQVTYQPTYLPTHPTIYLPTNLKSSHEIIKINNQFFFCQVALLHILNNLGLSQVWCLISVKSQIHLAAFDYKYSSPTVIIIKCLIFSGFKKGSASRVLLGLSVADLYHSKVAIFFHFQLLQVEQSQHIRYLIMVYFF